MPLRDDTSTRWPGGCTAVSPCGFNASARGSILWFFIHWQCWLKGGAEVCYLSGWPPCSSSTSVHAIVSHYIAFIGGRNEVVAQCQMETSNSFWTCNNGERIFWYRTYPSYKIFMEKLYQARILNMSIILPNVRVRMSACWWLKWKYNRYIINHTIKIRRYKMSPSSLAFHIWLLFVLFFVSWVFGTSYGYYQTVTGLRRNALVSQWCTG